MRGKILGVDQFAIENGQSIDKRRRAGRNRVPGSKRESLGKREAVQAGNSCCQRLMVRAKRVQRKIAVDDECLVLGVLTVEADQNDRSAEEEVEHPTQGHWRPR